MAALTCDICGGKIIMQTGALAKCESCGMEYTKERMQEKVQEIKGTVKVDGPVETIKGEAEKERLLMNAKTYVELNDFNKAKALYSEITVEYPNDWRCWWEFAMVITKEIDSKSTIKIKNDAFEPRFDLLEIYSTCLKVCTEDKVRNSLIYQWNKYWDTVADGIIAGMYLIGNLKTFSPADNAFNTFHQISKSMKNIIEIGRSNAKKLSKNNIRYGYLHDGETKGWLPYDGKHNNSIDFAIGRQLLWNDINTPYDADTSGIEVFKSPLRFDQESINKIFEVININQASLIKSDYCPLCGHYPLDKKMFGAKECRICQNRFR